MADKLADTAARQHQVEVRFAAPYLQMVKKVIAIQRRLIAIVMTLPKSTYKQDIVIKPIKPLTKVELAILHGHDAVVTENSIFCRSCLVRIPLNHKSVKKMLTLIVYPSTKQEGKSYKIFLPQDIFTTHTKCQS